jgi:hypothetical protein
MDLVRLLLLEAEGHEKMDLSNYTEEQQTYHSAQLIDAGLVRGAVLRDDQGTATGTAVVDLTWAGHDFLAPARSEGTWKKAMAKIKSAGVDLPIAVLKDLLMQLSKDALGI